ncbi:hypothetical protein [Enterococcus sp. LJL90]
MKNYLAEEILQAAQEYLAIKEIPFLPFSGYQAYLEKGNRLNFEKLYFARRRQLAVMGLACTLAPQAEALNFLEQIIWEVCNEYSWALPAHLSIANQQFTEDAPQCLDLFAAKTGQALAEIYERNYSVLSPMIKKRIESEMQRRIFQPFLARPWEWEVKENNWSSVVGGSIGMAALSMLPPDSPQLKRIVSRLEQSMLSYLAGFGEDGVCQEGVGYWGYGFGYYLYYAVQLAEQLGDQHLLTPKKVRRIAEFPYFTHVNENNFIPFSDYTTSFLPDGLLAFCQNYFKVAIPKLSQRNHLDDDHCYRYAHLSRSLSWKRGSELMEEKSFTCYFSDSQWFISKNLEEAVFFAVKGGRNDESHNQLDIGHFVFGSVAEMFLTDLGAGEYTQAYFDEATRYQIKPNDALSHSLPIINGEVQKAGKFTAELIENSEDLCFELAETYQDPELVSFQRQYSQKGRQLLLSDSFVFANESNKNTVKENFITLYYPHVSGRKIQLCGEQTYCLIEVESDDITIHEESFLNHNGEASIFYRISVNYQQLPAKVSLKHFVTIKRP